MSPLIGNAIAPAKEARSRPNGNGNSPRPAGIGSPSCYAISSARRRWPCGSQYAPAFHDNDIECHVLRSLTAEDLSEIGIASVGYRRRLLDAIVSLPAPAPAAERSQSQEIPTGWMLSDELVLPSGPSTRRATTRIIIASSAAEASSPGTPAGPPNPPSRSNPHKSRRALGLAQLIFSAPSRLQRSEDAGRPPLGAPPR